MLNCGKRARVLRLTYVSTGVSHCGLVVDIRHFSHNLIRSFFLESHQLFPLKNNQGYSFLSERYSLITFYIEKDNKEMLAN